MKGAGEGGSITYKFIDRGAFMLQQAQRRDEGANEYASRLHEIYKTRCSLVHGSGTIVDDWKNPKDLELLESAEEFSRISLCYVLECPEMFETAKLDEMKRARY